ncbi:hypothetical protein PG985_014258 [Apiospora marii]|uniref:C2H2-type domain-containing protein n=1 Tax=Apiospora marii TaxID=335849 RepID=A0ABR1R5H0_9PEZI
MASDNTSISYTGRGFRGELIEHGRKVRCLMPPHADRRINEDDVCNSVISNTRHDISSHISRQHEERAHYQDTKKNPDNPWVCPCGDMSWDKWVNFLAHLRSVHGFRGESKFIKKAGGVQLDKNNRVIMPNNIEAPDASPKGPEKKKDDEDDGPSGAAGGFIEASA